MLMSAGGIFEVNVSTAPLIRVTGGPNEDGEVDDSLYMISPLRYHRKWLLWAEYITFTLPAVSWKEQRWAYSLL